jgi:predicted dienelactone hydrolase
MEQATKQKGPSMKTLSPCLALLSLLGVTSALAQTGLSIQTIEAPHHGRAMETAVFYPGEGGTDSIMGENGVFYGINVRDDAVPIEGKHPVVLLSHGWGGNFKRMGWLSKGLVDKGAIVIAVNHPNSTTGELGNLHALDHWTRAQDLSVALDAVMANPRFSRLIDAKRIYAAGFSYGGWTALSLGGLKGNRDGLEQFCNDSAQLISHCGDILKSGIRISGIDRAKWEASYKDPRISAVAAIDPALTWGVDEAAAAGLNVPVLLIGLGEGDDRLHATDTSEKGSDFEAVLKGVLVERIVPATHFTALGLCKPAGPAILADEKDDPVCTDPEGTDRRAVTDRIIGLIAAHFKL